MAGRIDVDVIAFSTSRNDLVEPEAIARLERAIELGAGFPRGQPQCERGPETRARSRCSTSPNESGLPVDLHLDEHLEPAKMLRRMVVDAVIARGLQGRVTLSHLCALATLEASAARALIEQIARAGITVDRPAGDQSVPAGSRRAAPRCGAA